MKLNSNTSYLHPVRGKTLNYIYASLGGFHATATIHLLQSFHLVPSCHKLQMFNLWYCGGLAESSKLMLERTSVGHPVQDPCSNHRQPEQAAQGHIQFSFECHQGQTPHNLSGQSVPVLDHSHHLKPNNPLKPQTTHNLSSCFQFVPKLLFLYLCILKII